MVSESIQIDSTFVIYSLIRVNQVKIDLLQWKEQCSELG